MDYNLIDSQLDADAALEINFVAILVEIEVELIISSRFWKYFTFLIDFHFEHLIRYLNYFKA